MSVDCWACIEINPNVMDAYNFHIPEPSIDFGDARDGNQEVLDIINGAEITDTLIMNLIELPNSSTESKASIYQFLECHKGKRIYFVYC